MKEGTTERPPGTEAKDAAEDERSDKQPVRSALEPLQVSGDEHVLFALPKLNSNRRPMVTLGKSPRTGQLLLHFRIYRRDGRAKSPRWDMTQAGCTLTPAEFDDLVRKLDELTRQLPELAGARRKVS